MSLTFTGLSQAASMTVLPMIDVQCLHLTLTSSGRWPRSIVVGGPTLAGPARRHCGGRRLAEHRRHYCHQPLESDPVSSGPIGEECVTHASNPSFSLDAGSGRRHGRTIARVSAGRGALVQIRSEQPA